MKRTLSLTHPGILLREEAFTLVKKVGNAGEQIAKHNHPEALVLFTVVKGKVRVFLNGTEEYEAVPGTVIHFDGNNYINADYLEDSEIFITLIKKSTVTQSATRSDG